MVAAVPGEVDAVPGHPAAGRAHRPVLAHRARARRGNGHRSGYQPLVDPGPTIVGVIGVARMRDIHGQQDTHASHGNKTKPFLPNG
jgi:hypothetical protein